MNGSGRDGAAVFMAMFPVLLSDKEFEENFNEYYEEMRVGYPDMKKATEVMAILCDNVYRRLNDETCVAHVKTVIDKSGNLMRVSSSHLDSGTFEPTRVLAGEFTIFAKTGPAVIKKGATAIDHVTFVKQYSLGTRKLSQLEEGLVPELPPWYVIPSEVVDICKHAQATTGKSMPMRNFLLRGPAGTGKTMGAKAIAAGLGLPYMKYTCSANTEVFDFIGMIFPDSEETSTGDAQLDAEKQALLGMGGITYENIAKLMQLPDLADMDYDPAGVYMTLTGVENLNATSQDCMAIVLDRVTEKIKDVSKSVEKKEGQGQTYRYLETDFIKALKYGYVIEIQEPTTIMQPGVLVGLNSLLEQTGTITLPTGEVIKRHPDAVVVITTNVDYEGCRGMNQSVIDRMSLVRDVELPTPEVMVERAMSVTGVQASDGGTVERNTDYKREHYDAAASDIDRLLDKMAEKAACKELESERIRELNEVAQNISYGNIHEGVYVRVNRIDEVDEDLVNQYHAISDPLIYISKQLQKSLVKQLKDNRTGGKQTGLVMGRRLDTHALCRNDGKVFYKNRLPNEIPELAVGLLLDESGSMCSADRSTYARAAAIILHDFCESLEIPVMVYGHTTGYDKQGNDTVELFSYVHCKGVYVLCNEADANVCQCTSCILADAVKR